MSRSTRADTCTGPISMSIYPSSASSIPSAFRSRVVSPRRGARSHSRSTLIPFHLEVFGLHLAAWDAMFLVAVVAGYGVLRFAVALPGVDPAVTAIAGYRLLLGYLVTVYVTALGAQLLSYAFDHGTTLVPPPGSSPWSYYLNPMAGPKTLYGCVLALPLAVTLLRAPPVRLPLTLGAGLDLWTPPLLAVLAIVRVGCLLQGCCYGIVSHTLGLRFAEGSIAYNAQVASGLIERGGEMVPVVPAQLVEAVFLLGLLLWSFRMLHAGRRRVFVPAMVAYSTLRIAIEVVRADPVRNSFGPFSTSQWVALGVIAAAALVRYAERARRRAESVGSRRLAGRIDPL